MRKLSWKKQITRPLPPIVDLRHLDIPIYDQKDQGSCTANAGAAAYEFILKQRGIEFSGSRDFLYYAERMIDGDPGKDAGSSLHTTAHALARYGICEEKLWPYSDADLLPDPTVKCWQSALGHRITQGLVLAGLMAMKQWLTQRQCPFIFGMEVYASFENTVDGYIPMPAKSEEYMGGHAVCAVGYDDAKQVFICRNSWGDSWADKGYFYLPYAYMTDQNLSDEHIGLII
jgi:C1A family cysteine protease